MFELLQIPAWFAFWSRTNDCFGCLGLARKAIALWKCGRNNQLAWFICIVVFNTVGILPILYLVWGQQNRNVPAAPPLPQT
jgi:hypothetical protein